MKQKKIIALIIFNLTSSIALKSPLYSINTSHTNLSSEHAKLRAQIKKSIKRAIIKENINAKELLLEQYKQFLKKNGFEDKLIYELSKSLLKEAEDAVFNQKFLNYVLIAAAGTAILATTWYLKTNTPPPRRDKSLLAKPQEKHVATRPPLKTQHRQAPSKKVQSPDDHSKQMKARKPSGLAQKAWPQMIATYSLGRHVIKVVQGCITRAFHEEDGSGGPQKGDFFVNAANNSLADGSAVCGAIFDAAGNRTMQQACDEARPDKIMGLQEASHSSHRGIRCKTGDAVLAGKIEDGRVIHGVAPNKWWWQKNLKMAVEKLKSTVSKTLDIAKSKASEVESTTIRVAVPAISTGIFTPSTLHGKNGDAAKAEVVSIITKEIKSWFAKQQTFPKPMELRFVGFDAKASKWWTDALDAWTGEPKSQLHRIKQQVSR
ncbi:macro domain-containing protein [Candidatus Dependentiae bacterium]